jgi:hypothetical protein
MNFNSFCNTFFKIYFYAARAESKYKIINVKHHRRMKRDVDGGNEDVDSTINIKIGDNYGELWEFM